MTQINRSISLYNTTTNLNENFKGEKCYEPDTLINAFPKNGPDRLTSLPKPIDLKTPSLWGAEPIAPHKTKVPQDKISLLKTVGYLGLGLLSLLACNPAQENPESSTDSLEDSNEPDLESGDTSNDVSDGADTTGSTDTGYDSTGDDGSTGEFPAEPTLPGEAEVFASVPCGAGSFISDLDAGLGACANFASGANHLFAWDVDANNSATSLSELVFPPDQVLALNNGGSAITHMGNGIDIPAGVALLSDKGASPAQYPFPEINLGGFFENSLGQPVSQFTPNQPKGIAEANGRLFVATSNLVFDAATNSVHYNPGTLMILDPASGEWDAIQTSGFNPTSVASHNNLIYVVTSGDVNAFADSTQGEPVVTTPSYLEIVDPDTLEIIDTIDLGLSAAGIQGEITFSEDGSYAFIPTGDNSARILQVELASGAIEEISLSEIQTKLGEKTFLTGTALSPEGDYLAVGAYNQGQLVLMDNKTGALLGQRTLDTNPKDYSGISDGLQTSGAFYYAVGENILRLGIGE